MWEKLDEEYMKNRSEIYWNKNMTAIQERWEKYVQKKKNKIWERYHKKEANIWQICYKNNKNGRKDVGNMPEICNKYDVVNISQIFNKYTIKFSRMEKYVCYEAFWIYPKYVSKKIQKNAKNIPKIVWKTRIFLPG